MVCPNIAATLPELVRNLCLHFCMMCLLLPVTKAPIPKYSILFGARISVYDSLDRPGSQRCLLVYHWIWYLYHTQVVRRHPQPLFSNHPKSQTMLHFILWMICKVTKILETFHFQGLILKWWIALIFLILTLCTLFVYLYHMLMHFILTYHILTFSWSLWSVLFGS